MLEGWTTLGFMAAHTPAGPARADGRRRPLPQPGPVGQGRDDARRPVRRPGLARASVPPGTRPSRKASASPGRALAERFEMLEDTLRIAHGMWQGERGSEEDFDGRQFHAARLLNVPQSISRPRVPILIGGGGEKKTLRLVAQYADASNLFGGPEQLVPKYSILAEHCEAVGRDFTEIERTNMQGVGLGSGGAWSQAAESPDAIVERLRTAGRGGRPARDRELRRGERPGRSSSCSGARCCPSSVVSRRPTRGASQPSPEDGSADEPAGRRPRGTRTGGTTGMPRSVRLCALRASVPIDRAGETLEISLRTRSGSSSGA